MMPSSVYKVNDLGIIVAHVEEVFQLRYAIKYSSSRTICCKSAVQDGMAVAGEKRHIHEEREANAEKVARD